MPIHFPTAKFNEPIDQAINTIYAALCEDTREVLMEHLQKLKGLLPAFYHQDLSISAPVSQAEIVYREFIQYLICYVCQNINREGSEQLGLLLASLCPNLFTVEDKNLHTRSDTIFWTDPALKDNVLNTVERSRFKMLFRELMRQAYETIAHEPPDRVHPLLKQYMVIFEFKRELLNKINDQLSLNWGKYEHRLRNEWELFLQSCPNHHVIPIDKKWVPDDFVIPLSPNDVDDLINWFDYFQQAITHLIRTFPDPITGKSLLEQERVIQEGRADFMCFLSDRYAYFASTFKTVLQTRSPPTDMIESPVTHRMMENIAEKSHSLELIFEIQQGVMSLKEHILLNSNIAVYEAFSCLCPPPPLRPKRTTRPAHAPSSQHSTEPFATRSMPPTAEQSSLQASSRQGRHPPRPLAAHDDLPPSYESTMQQSAQAVASPHLLREPVHSHTQGFFQPSHQTQHQRRRGTLRQPSGP